MDHRQLSVISVVAGAQHGVFSVAQAAQVGVSARQLATAARAGFLVRVHPVVYRFAAVPPTPSSIVLGGTLQAGPRAAGSHEAALVVRGIDRLPVRPVVTVPPGSRADHPGIRVHRFGDLRDSHRDVVGGIPVTTLERAVVDLASTVSRVRLDWLIDRLTITDRLVSTGGIARVLRQVNRRGRRHIARLQEELDRRRPGEPVSRSTLEERVDRLLDGTGLPTPDREYPLPSGVPGEGLVDRAWPEALLILEVDGRRWHARERSMARDRARDRAAATHGWLTMRVLDEEVADLPGVLVQDLLTVHRLRLGMLGAHRPPENL